MLYCISVVPDIEEDMHEKCRFDLHLRIRCHGNFSGMVRADADSQRKLPVFRDEGAAFCGEKARTHGGGKHVAGSRFFSSCKNAAGNGVEDAPGHGEAAAGAEHGE